MGGSEILDELKTIAAALRSEFEADRRVMSFQEYLGLFATKPKLLSRDAVQYVRDVFDYFGRVGEDEDTSFRLFDLPWLSAEDAGRLRLVGQQQVQRELYRVLNNFAREGRQNRLPLLHGPNGSAKSTVARCIMLALEHYSSLDEGALYRFHWVFPTRKTSRGAIGFGGEGELSAAESFAHLPEAEIDARLVDEMRDHPLLLLPRAARVKLLERLSPEGGAERNGLLWEGALSHKNRAVFEALLSSAQGELEEVLRHVQVERYYISRKYRQGAVTLGPELNVDAGERQLTADRSLTALPTSLQAIALFEAHGELVDAAGGLLEFSDLLKRPLDAFKYLQLTVETGEFALPNQNVSTNCVMLASANEQELGAFRAHPEFESFRGRLELIKTPYLLDWRQEKEIYDAQVAPRLRDHVAPHATTMAAMFAVLTRLRRPDVERHPRAARDVLRSLSAVEKLDLYSGAVVPERLDSDEAKLLRSLVVPVAQEAKSHERYEGSFGASPREMRAALLDAAQDEHISGLSPFAVLDRLESLCEREGEFAWLARDAEEGGYGDHVEFRVFLRRRLFDLIEDEFRRASGLVDESRYGELFDRYITHVSYWVKQEKVRNPLTGDHEEPDEALMLEVETLLGGPDERAELRKSWMSQVAAWAIEHPGQRVKNEVVFKDVIGRLRDAVFASRRHALAKLVRDLVLLRTDRGVSLTDVERSAALAMSGRMVEQFGYVDASVVDAAIRLFKERLSDVE